MTPMDKMREALAKKAAVAKRVAATPDGAEFLAILRKEFFSTLAAKDEHAIVFNAGRADVIAYIQGLLDYEPEGR